MAPSYTTGLVDVDLCESGGKTWAEPTAAGWTMGAGPSSDDDNPFQGLLAMSKAFNAVGVGGQMVNNGAGITLPTDGAFLVWFYWAAPGSLEADVDGGIRIMVGTDLANFLSWDVGGKTTYVYGGWINYAVNTTVTADDTVGTGLGNSQYVGAAVNNYNSIFKGNPFLTDAVRYGRCEARMSGGVDPDYATFNGYAAVNDAVNNRWGLIQAIAGGYLVKGLIIFGYGAVVDFRDANKSIIIQNTNKVTANFNAFEVRQATSRVDLTAITITALGTVSRGRWITTDNADVNLDTCVFTDMDTFQFLSNTSALNCTFRRCSTITAPGCYLNGTKVDSSTVAADASAVIWDVATNPDGFMDDMTFVKGTNAHHAINFGASASTTITLRGLTFTNFNVTNGQNDSVLHLSDQGSDKTWTIGCVGCSGTVSYKKARAGDTVNITQGVAFSIHVQDAITQANIVGAAVMAKAAASGPKPYQASVSIVQSGGTATVTHTTHGLATNDYVIIEGCNEGEYNGGWKITWASADTYTYTLIGSPSSPATGTPVSTFAPIYGTTDGSGNISDTRTYSSNQPFTGRVRKATSAPYYKTMPISGAIDSGSGASLVVNMISDD